MVSRDGPSGTIEKRCVIPDLSRYYENVPTCPMVMNVNVQILLVNYE